MHRILYIGLFVLAVGAILYALPAFAQTATPKTPAAPDNGLIITDVKVGTGRVATAGSKVTVNYTGWLYDPSAPQSHGKQFDSSIGREPFSFDLGAGVVIPGWDQGVVGMKVHGKRTLVIPGQLAYGARGAGRDIPPNATLIFDVDLLAVK